MWERKREKEREGERKREKEGERQIDKEGEQRDENREREKEKLVYLFVCVCMYECVCLYIYIYIYIYLYVLTHTHTHTHIYIYIYWESMCLNKLEWICVVRGICLFGCVCLHDHVFSCLHHCGNKWHIWVREDLNMADSLGASHRHIWGCEGYCECSWQLLPKNVLITIITTVTLIYYSPSLFLQSESTFIIPLQTGTA